MELQPQAAPLVDGHCLEVKRIRGQLWCVSRVSGTRDQGRWVPSHHPLIFGSSQFISKSFVGLRTFKWTIAGPVFASANLSPMVSVICDYRLLSGFDLQENWRAANCSWGDWLTAAAPWVVSKPIKSTFKIRPRHICSFFSQFILVVHLAILDIAVSY